MVKLDELQMKSIKGGMGAAGWAAILGALAFFAGMLDGYTRPFKCR